MQAQNMTDNEIKKALECCGRESCLGCPYRGNCHQGNPMIRDALDYINRLEAENDILCGKIDELIIDKDLLFDEAEALIKKAKAEAYKEFAERFKEKLSQKYTTSLWKFYCEEIDNLLKEMESESNG